MLEDVDDSPAAVAGRAVGGLLVVAGVAVATYALANGGATGVVGGAVVAVVGALSVGVPAIPVVVGRGVADLVGWIVFEVVWRLVAGLVGALLDGV